MIDHSCRVHPYLPAGEHGPPAKIYLLHMGKKHLVQSSRLSPQPGAYHKSGPGGPEHPARSIVLSPVLLNLGQNTSSTIRKIPPVHESAACSRVLEHRPAVITQNLRSTCSATGMRVHETLQFPEPSVRNLYVRIEQQIVVKPFP